MQNEHIETFEFCRKENGTSHVFLSGEWLYKADLCHLVRVIAPKSN